MNWLNEITQSNFHGSFNLKEILEKSVFYPAAGIDALPIEGLNNYSNSFVHVDYSHPKEQVETGLRIHFDYVGYDLVGLREVTQNELTPNGFTLHNFPLKQSERERMHFQQDSIRRFKPFALWAVYQLRTDTPNKNNKVERFSILHIGGEACATFDALYVNNGINPLAVSIISPAEGYGDNWTIFRDPDYRLYKLIDLNKSRNGATLPEYVYTTMCSNDECFWPNYTFMGQRPSFSGGKIFKLMKTNDLNTSKVEKKEAPVRPSPIRRTKPSILPRPKTSFYLGGPKPDGEEK